MSLSNLTCGVVLGLISASSFAAADDVRTVQLQRGDGFAFKKILAGLTRPEPILDPTHPVRGHVVRRYESRNGALQMVCSTELLVGSDGYSDCSLTFDLSKSTPELEVSEGKVAGALVVKFNDRHEASRISQRILPGFWTTLEKISVKMLDGKVYAVPRVRIDCEKVPNSGGVAESCTLVAVPDQVG